MRVMLFGRAQLALAGALSVLALSACDPPPPTFKPVSIADFQAAPSPVAAGGDVTLSWQVAGDVDHLQLLKGSETLAAPSETTGTFKVEKLAAGTATFSLVAVGKGGDEVRQSAEVTAVTKPTVGKFAADKTQIAAGTGVVLSWTSALADKVEITANGASLGQKTGEEAAQGALLVKPEVTTEYALTASGVGGSDKAKVTVTVLPAPAFSTLEVTPAKVKAGEQATLRWVTTGANSLTVKVAGRAVYTAATEDVGSGTKNFTPDSATTYQVSISGPGGELTQEVTLHVVQLARVVSFRSEPSDIIVGDSLVLSWDLVGVDEVALKANGEPVDLQGHTNALDSVVLQPQTTTVYEISGQGEGGQTAGALTVNVYGVPTIDQFESDRATVFRRREPATLTWVTHNGAQVSIADSAGNIVDTGSQPASGGSVQVNPDDTTDYTLTLVGPAGVLESAPVHIEVVEPPPAVTLTVAKSTLLEGQQTVLSWDLTDFDSFTLDANGSALDVSNKLPKDVLSISPTETTVYTLTALGPGGHTQKQLTVTVVKQPKFTVFTTDKIDANGNTTVTRGKQFTVTWDTTDAESTAFDPARLGGDTDPFVSIIGLPGTQNATLQSVSGIYELQDEGVAVVAFPDGFKFPFFGSTYTDVRMNTNGYLCFGGDSQCSAISVGNYYRSPANIPSTGLPNNFIAPFWDELNGYGTGKFVWRIDGIAPDRRMTFEWQTDFGNSSDKGTQLNFQAVLFESGEWEIRHAPRPTPTANASSTARWGSTATIGIEGPGGTSGQLGSYQTTSGLCSTFVAATGNTPAQCTPITRLRPERLGPSGSQAFTASTTGVVRMKAFGPLGTTPSRDLVITVVEPALAVSLSAARTLLGAGDITSLNWSVGPIATQTTPSPVKRIVVSNGTTRLIDNANPTVFSGSLSISPTTDTTYTLEAYNAAGDKDTKTVTVKVAAPTATLKVTDDRTSVPQGDQIELSWTTAGANSVVLKRPDGTVESGPFHLITDAAKVAANKVKITASASGTYTLEATNGSGTTSATVAINVLTDLQIAVLSVTPTEQTAKRNVTLTWEVYNGTSVTVTVQGEDAPLAGFPITDLGKVRSFSQAVPVRTTDTTYELTATGNDGSVLTRSVTVVSVPEPSVTAFTASPAAVNWGEKTTLRWTSTGATKLALYELVGSGPNATLGKELTQARNQLNGSVELTLFKPTGFRLVVENRLGAASQATKDLDPAVQVNVTNPSIQLAFNPANGVPRGGYADLSWSATQAERVYLWGSDAQYVPNQFVDISTTGTVVDMKSGGTGAINYDTGYVNFALPAGFSPVFFGEPMTKIGITADGVVGLASGTNSPYCGSTSGCSGAGTLPNTTYKAAIAVFSRDLTACAGYSSGTTCSPRSSSGRGPGKIFTELKGTSPNRFYVVQWNDWDFWSDSSASLTFQAKIFESGVVELQYKTMISTSSSAFTGSGGIGVQNWAGTVAFNINNRPIASGDGWRIDTNSGAPQVPFDYVPFGFKDISPTGTLQTLTSSNTPNFDIGSVTVPFTDGFAPIFFGEAMTGATISADGVVSLSGSNSYTCTAGCSSIGTLPTTSYKALVSAFNANLSACAGATSGTTCAARGGRAPGKLFTQLTGTSPNRVFVAQWTDWDFQATASSGSLTFQVKIHENGDAEVAFKTLESKSSALAQGSGVTVGVQNTAGSVGVNASTGSTTAWRPLAAGDGYRFFSGNQAPVGTVRTFFNLPPTATSLTYRGTALNSILPTGVTDTKTVPLLAGVDDILINELMIDPVDGPDDDKEWIELRNTRALPAPLAGYTIQTSSGSYTFTGGQIPAKTTSGDGLLVIGMSADIGRNGGVPVSVAYGNQVQMHDQSDSVVLRYGNVLIDRVEYDTGAGWPTSRATSLSLDTFVSTGAGNDIPKAWCPGRSPSDVSARSSAGLANSTCMYVPYDPSLNIAADPAATVVIGTGTGNDRAGTLTLGFPFVLDGTTYTTMSVNDNGWASFGATASGSSWANQPLPNAGYGGVDGLYPYWDDLYPKSGRGKIYTKTMGTAPNRTQVVMWDGYSTSSSGTDEITMMIVLHEDGAIEFQYAAMTASGSSATIGYEYAGDTAALQVGYNQAVFPMPGLPAQFGLRMR